MLKLFPRVSALPPFPYKFLSYFIIIVDGEWHALRVREQPTGAISFSDIKDAATHKEEKEIKGTYCGILVREMRL